MKYQKRSNVQGKWLKGNEVKSGTKCKLVSETTPQPSQFTDQKGNLKMQDVAKIRFQGSEETLNISINRASIEGLIDAFGDDSKNWIGKILTAETEKVRVAGVQRFAVYLVPEGYEIQNDQDGYAHIVDPKKETIQEPPHDDPNVELDVNGNEADISEIPF